MHLVLMHDMPLIMMLILVKRLCHFAQKVGENLTQENGHELELLYYKVYGHSFF